MLHATRYMNIVVKIRNWLLLTLLLLLPWQTRWIYQPAMINGGFWEYGSYSLYGTEILLCLILLLSLISRCLARAGGASIFSRSFFWTHRYNFLLILLFLSSLVIILLNSLDAGLAYYWLTVYIFSACLFLAILISGNNFARSGAAVWLSGLSQGILAIVQFLTQKVFASKWLGLAWQSAAAPGSSVVEFSAGRWLRAYGSLGHPNALGIYLGAVWLLGFILYIGAQKQWHKIILSAGQIIITAGLFFTFSRGAWLAVAAGWLVLLILVWPSKSAGRQKFIQLSIYSAGMAIILLALFFTVFGARFNLQNRLEAASLNERDYQISVWQEIFNRRPLLGVGPGNYTLAFYLLEPHLNFWQYQPVHSALLLLLSEFGLLMFVLFLMCLFFYIKKFLKSDNLSAALLIFLLFSCLFDHWLASAYAGIMFSGVALALAVLDSQSAAR